MKMFEVLALQEIYLVIKDKQMPIKTAYKFSRLMKRVEEEVQFYSKEFDKILNQYAKKEDGHYVLSEDGSSIIIISGKEEECNQKIIELRSLEVDLKDFQFDLEELESFDLTFAQLNTIFPLIKN